MSEEMTRKEVIDWLYRLKSYVPTFMPKIWHEKFIKALQFAIASLKTDEAYQLEFENRDCVEVVRCKDCKYYRNKENKRSYCTKRLNVDSVTDRYREPNFYCADAVLREVVEHE